jgi:hypothetical protein
MGWEFSPRMNPAQRMLVAQQPAKAFEFHFIRAGGRTFNVQPSALGATFHFPLSPDFSGIFTRQKRIWG